MKNKQKLLIFVLEGASNETLEKIGHIMNEKMPELHCIMMSAIPRLYLLDRDKLFDFVEQVKEREQTT